MDPERWQQIEAIFLEASELEGEVRRGYLDRACPDDGVRSEVEKLLRQYEESDSFISQPLAGSTRGSVLASLMDDSDEDPLTGKVVGRYRIEREIGRGGMGAVYEASRADGEYRQRVAVKVVKRGVDTDFVLRRFRNERQILAALDHPFITRLIDGGTTDDGRPYFVMEYIEGQPLHEYADAEKLSIDDRLRLFAKICETVEYAHSKLVIHRDLKPSNILIAGDGNPRLLDFGIAKLLDPEMASDTLQPTATALRMMTVDYASPEQVRGDKVTYATDVYSLGVLLFELLTGRRPYRTLSRNPHDIAKAICDEHIPLASEAVSPNSGFPAVRRPNAAASKPEEIAAVRGETEQSLPQKLTDDPDNIIAKALGKAPSERYTSVAELRADIERYLVGEKVSVGAPAQVRPASRVDNSAAGGKLVAVLPLSFLGPSHLSSTDDAYLTIGLADAIITRLAGMKQLTVRPTSSITRYGDEPVNPLRAGEELGVDFVVDGRIRHFSERLRVSLQLLDVKTRTAIWAGHFDEEMNDVLDLEDAISAQVVASLLPHLTGAERKTFSKRGTDDPRAFEAYLKGRFYWNQFTAQSFEKVIESYNRAIEIDPNYALAHVGIADFYIWAAIYGIVPSAEAEVLAEAAARRALEIDPELGEAYATMALLVKNRFEFAASEKLFKRSLELRPHYSQGWEWYGSVLIGVGRTREGIEMSDRAEELDPLSLRAKTLGTWLHYQAHDFHRALEKAEEIIRIDPNYPQGHIQRAFVLCEFGRAEEAIANIDRAAELMPDSPLVWFNQAVVYAEAGHRDESRGVLDKMHEAAKVGHIKPYFLGIAHAALGEYDEAFANFEKAFEEHDPWMIWWQTEPKLRRLADDPRYTDLLNRMGLPIDYSVATGGSAARTSVPFDAAVTLLAEDPATGGVPVPIHRKSWFKRAVAATMLSAFIAAAYFSGILSVSFSDRRMVPVAEQSGKIAVLPFANLTGDAANDEVLRIVQAAVVERLSHTANGVVVPNVAPAVIDGKSVSLVQEGKDLGASFVCSTTLTRDGNELVLRTEVTRVADRKSMMSMTYADKQEQFRSDSDRIVIKLMEVIERAIAIER
ncbi:MAG: protein kinase [Acidobacteriota bacterium]|nr:MAG: protein kinase [Acidobacteriota bacterium]